MDTNDIAELETAISPQEKLPAKAPHKSSLDLSSLEYGEDPYAAVEFLTAEKLEIEPAILSFKRSDKIRTEKAIYALACCAAKTEYPGDRKQNRVSKNFEDLMQRSKPAQEIPAFYVATEVLTELNSAAERNLAMALVTVNAALAAVTALQAVNEPLPEIGNLHPVRYAQKVNRHAADFFRGRVPGLPM